jgi:hypothetical protein
MTHATWRHHARPLALLAATTLWGGGLVAAPYALTHEHVSRGVQRLAVAAYGVGRVVCHQRPERSFVAWTLPLPVCARCAGLYAGAPLGVLFGLVASGRWRFARRRHPLETARRGLVIASVPMLVSVVLEFGAGLAVPGWVRAVTALPLAAVVGWVSAAGLCGDLDHARSGHPATPGPVGTST